MDAAGLCKASNTGEKKMGTNSDTLSAISADGIHLATGAIAEDSAATASTATSPTTRPTDPAPFTSHAQCALPVATGLRKARTQLSAAAYSAIPSD